jgi:hypothetical protein
MLSRFLNYLDLKLLKYHLRWWINCHGGSKQNSGGYIRRWTSCYRCIANYLLRSTLINGIEGDQK